MTLADAMRALEEAGSAQTRKTYLRHGATEPLFGVSFATLQVMRKRIGVDHDLGLALWATGNLDARNLAVKIVDPARITSSDLDRWVLEWSAPRMCAGYVGMLAAETDGARERAEAWLAADDEAARSAGWTVVAQLAMRDESVPDSFFAALIDRIARSIHGAPNREREHMHNALIAIGCRHPSLRAAARGAAERIGPVEIDYGDTACKTPDAGDSIDKAWAHATSKGFDSPAAQERKRERLRLRC
jgi:3-methyladenine DNA glycosylase AlkD